VGRIAQFLQRHRADGRLFAEKESGCRAHAQIACSVKILLERDIILGILDWQRGDGMAVRETLDKPVVPDVRHYRDAVMDR